MQGSEVISEKSGARSFEAGTRSIPCHPPAPFDNDNTTVYDAGHCQQRRGHAAMISTRLRRQFLLLKPRDEGLQTRIRELRSTG